MSPQELSAFISPEWLALRCIEEGDCLLWTQSTNDSGQPRYTFRIGDKSMTKQLRQVVWYMAGKPQLREGQVLTVTCGCQACLNSDHMKPTTMRAVIAKTSRRPDVVRRVTVASAVAHRARAKITMEQADYIRNSDKTLREMSEEFGISIAWASKVRRGEGWRNLRASPFAGLMG